MGNHWNYRVMEFIDNDTGYKWRAIHEVHYEDDVPIGFSENPAVIIWDSKNDDEVDVSSILKRMALAIDCPVLTVNDFNRD